MRNVSIYFSILLGHSCCIYFLKMILILSLRHKRRCVHMSCKAQPFGWCPHSVQTPTKLKCQYYNWKQLQRAKWLLGVEDTFDRKALHLLVTFSWETVEDSWTLRQQIWALVKDPLLTMCCGQLLDLASCPRTTSLIPPDLKGFQGPCMKYGKCYENIKSSFTSKESGPMVCNLKNAELCIVGEIEVGNISPFSD